MQNAKCLWKLALTDQCSAGHIWLPSVPAALRSFTCLKVLLTLCSVSVSGSASGSVGIVIGGSVLASNHAWDSFSMSGNVMSLSSLLAWSPWYSWCVLPPLHCSSNLSLYCLLVIWISLSRSYLDFLYLARILSWMSLLNHSFWLGKVSNVLGFRHRHRILCRQWLRLCTSVSLRLL